MNPLIKTILSTNAGAGLAILRIVTGLTLMSHGSQKLFGMFGGAGQTAWRSGSNPSA